MKAEMYNFNTWILETNPKKLKDYFNKVLQDSGFNICSYIDKYFEPIGYTGLYLLSESHFAIHTFPEEQKTYIELSSCIKEPFIKFKKTLNHGNKYRLEQGG